MTKFAISPRPKFILFGLLLMTALLSPAAEPAPIKPDLCMVLCNHWTYGDIGWSYGLKSCEQSVSDSLDMADYTPSVKTSINLDPPAFALMAESNPALYERLKRYLSEGKVEIIGGTYQPMGSMLSGECNVRQLVAGQQMIRKILGVPVSTFLEEEEFTHPQMPQLLKGAGFRYASTAQCDTWGKHGSPRLGLNVFHWEGIDGTRILTTPVNDLVFHPPVVTHDIDWLWTPEGRQRSAEFAQLGMPLALKWVEFGWGPDELKGKTANKFFASTFRELSEHFNVRYTTVTEFLDEYGAQAQEVLRWRMDDFKKLQPWGCGGDQLRREQREVEAVLVAAERFDAAATLLGLHPGREPDLDSAWKNLFVSQGHGVSLCEYYDEGLDYGGINDPAARQFLADTGTEEENSRVVTWGDMGFRHLAAAERTGNAVLESALQAIAREVDTAGANHGRTAAVVFNPSGFTQDAIATVRGVPVEYGADVVASDAAGQPVPSQVLAAGEGRADVLIQTRQLPSVGYATFYLDPVKSGSPAVETDLRTSTTGWKMENALVSVELDPTNGGISRLVDQRTGLELIDDRRRPFPAFDGRPNREVPGGKEAPEAYVSATTRATISWVERGPLRAVVKVEQTWPMMRLEYLVSLSAGSPQVDVRIRLVAEVPPAQTKERVNVWQPPLHIPDGYWFSFVSAFQPTEVIRDFPFGIEAAGKDAIDALNFIDVTGPQGGLLVVHSGTQYFKRSEDRVFSNLAMRDFHGIFMKPGWPREAEYRFALVPHGKDFSNRDRLRWVENFDLRPACVVEGLHAGRLARSREFMALNSPNLLLSAFRGAGDGSYEVRVIEQAGRPASDRIHLDLPLARYAPADLIGNVFAPWQPLSEGAILVSLTPWQILTLRLETDSTR